MTAKDRTKASNVERLVCHSLSGKRNICELKYLRPGQPVVCAQRGGARWLAAIRAIEIGGEFPGAKGEVHLEGSGEPITLVGHLESIPYGFDSPQKYELVMDVPIDSIELAADEDGAQMPSEGGAHEVTR